MASPLWTQIRKKEKSHDELIKEAIKNVNIFRNLSDKEISEVKNAVYNRTYKKGDYIFKQDHPGNGMYIILTGTVQIIQEKFIGEEKTEEILAILHSGDFLGELSLLDEAPRSASALCTELTEAMGFFRGDLLDMVNRKPVLGSKIILNIARVLGERLRITNQMLSELQEKEKEKNNEHE